MTAYSKARLEMAIEAMDEIKKSYEEYLDLEAENNKLLGVLRRDFPASGEEPEPDREVKSFWDVLHVNILNVGALINREIKAYQTVNDHLEDEVAQMQARPHVSVVIMPFTDEDIIRRVKA